MVRNNRLFHLLPFFIYPVALTWAVQHDPFFWDTVQLASKHAHHFYENSLQWLPLPLEIDSGHPPVFGYYLALVWTFLGKSLPASHWAMLPFLMLLVWLLYRLGFRLGGERWGFWLLPLVLLDPVMAGQSVLVSPDVVLACGFLLAVEGISGKNKVFTTLGILILCMISVRGMMTAGALAVWILLEGLMGAEFPGFKKNKLQIIRFLPAYLFHFGAKNYLPFLPGFAFAAWFLWWHKEATGWVGLHPGSPWAPTFVPAKGLELVRNLLVIGWRWLDFGRAAEWLMLGWLIWKFRRTIAIKSYGSKNFFTLLLLLICLIIFLSPSALLFKNVSAHRYFLPGFLALHLLVFHFLARQNVRHVRLFTALVLAMALGNLLIYPRGVAMGWDATLAHLPYHRLRAEAVAYLEEQDIDFQLVGSAFPNLNTGENLLLNGNYRRFADKDFSQNEYFFTSNVFNDVNEADYQVLDREWVLIKKWQQAGVWIEIYRRKR